MVSFKTADGLSHVTQLMFQIMVSKSDLVLKHSSPDALATTASSTLVWLILEIGIIYLSLTVMSINTTLTKWDVLAFCRY